MDASTITELDEEQRQYAYKKYQLIEPYLDGTLKIHDIARNKQVPLFNLKTGKIMWLKLGNLFWLVTFYEDIFVSIM